MIGNLPWSPVRDGKAIQAVWNGEAQRRTGVNGVRAGYLICINQGGTAE